MSAVQSPLVFLVDDQPTWLRALSRVLQLAGAKVQSFEDPDALVEASHQLVYLDDRKRSEITRWLKKVANAFEQIGRERAELMGRLKSIAAMSSFEA